jgi:hypothetical protein
MSIKVYDPAVSVTLFKLIKRKDGVAQRYAGLRRQIDLTPFLGEGGSVRTSKSITQPAGGFTISFPDQPDATSGDTVYALVEPMDMVEIRMARNPGQYASGKLPLIMRGFVTAIGRPEAMGADGQPQRFVTIEGQDFGKLWLINNIFWQSIEETDGALLSFWQVGAAAGIAPAIYTASEFVSGMVSAFNKKLAPLVAFAAPAVVPLFSAVTSVPEGYTLPPQQAGLGEGSYWDILTAFADRPWNEIFIQDTEAGPQVIYRPVPYKDTNGNFIMPGAADPGTVAIDIAQVISHYPKRSDEKVANIFWVPPENLVLGSGGGVTAASLVNGTVFDFEHENDNPLLYGQKIMRAQSNLYGGSSNALGVAPSDQDAANANVTVWWNNRVSELRALNQDNSVWEDGSMTIQGSETIKPGQYLKLTRGSLVTTAYMTQVDHMYVPFQSWTVGVQFIRGDGFIVRDKFTGNPFWAEGRNGVYT